MGTLKAHLPVPSLDVVFAPEGVAALVGEPYPVKVNGTQRIAVITEAVIAPDGLSLSLTLATDFPTPSEYCWDTRIDGE
ncbi:hypothetical protein [Streptomyces niveus]|uniref:hypothetical protein n=1 Tax=Streptomyces niveus TaxID=193462 RepID=UPI00133199CD|nr:hypothetical protein [Streptomyces niveus]